jgi:hypothetical protein
MQVVDRRDRQVLVGGRFSLDRFLSDPGAGGRRLFPSEATQIRLQTVIMMVAT